MTLNVRPVGVSAVAFVERFGLSFVFFCLAWKEGLRVRDIWAQPLSSQSALFFGSVHHLVLLVVGAFTSLLLLFSRRPAVPPTRLKLVLVPLASTFFNLFYFLVLWVPAFLRKPLYPASLQMPLMVTGLVLIVTGPIIGLWGILTLGRSFGVFVTLRTVVLTGPYRWIRHPMYLGWICSCVGILLTNLTGAYVLIVTIHICVIVYRARLEEAHLCEHSPEYLEHMKRTGFILPRLRTGVAKG